MMGLKLIHVSNKGAPSVPCVKLQKDLLMKMDIKCKKQQRFNNQDFVRFQF